MLKINISKTGNGEELRKTLNSLESEGLISSEQSKKITSELDKLIDDRKIIPRDLRGRVQFGEKLPAERAHRQRAFPGRRWCVPPNQYSSAKSIVEWVSSSMTKIFAVIGLSVGNVKVRS